MGNTIEMDTGLLQRYVGKMSCRILDNLPPLLPDGTYIAAARACCNTLF